MQEYLDFVQRHALLVGGFVALLLFVIWTEIQRLTRGYQDISPQEAVRIMNDADPLVVDVRESNEITQGKIKGARHIPLSAFKQRVGELGRLKDKKVIVYCRSGSRSHHACSILKKQGFEEVYNLRGGVLSWQSDKLPLSKK